MNVKVENLPHSQSLVTVEVEPERMAKAREDAFVRFAREAVIPGFRKGKAPRNLVQRYVRPAALQEDAESQVMEEVWNELRADQLKETRFFDTPQVKVTQHEPLVLEITLTHEPSVQLGDYKGVRIAPELVTVTEQDVNETIERLRDQQAQWQPVTHRPVRQGDMVTVQAHGVVRGEPLVVPEGYSIAVEEKTAWIAPGFALRLVDMEPDQEKEFAVELQGDVVDPTTASLTDTVYVTVKEIKEKVTPALDDAFAQTMQSESVAALTEKVRTSLLKAREDAARDRLEEKVLDQVAEVSTVNFPAVMVNQQVERIIADRTEYLKQRGLSLDLYLQITKMSMDELRAEVRPDAEKRIRNYLLVEELGRAEGIMIEDDAVHAEIERVVGEQQDQEAARRELSTNDMHERVRSNLYLKGLFDRLIAMVTEGQEPVAPPAETKPDEAVAEASEEPAKAEEEKPKLIIATH